MIARHLSIQGRVQGVFYRGWAVDAAHGLGLAGWVRNRHDGTVDAIVKGEASAVERFIALAHDGPPSAVVERVEATGTKCDGSLSTFSQAATA